MAFDVPFDVRPSHFYAHRRVALAMCDFTSAGNAWSAENLLRVWLPQPMSLRNAYPVETWRLMNPELQSPPTVPASSTGTAAPGNSFGSCPRAST